MFSDGPEKFVAQAVRDLIKDGSLRRGSLGDGPAGEVTPDPNARENVAAAGSPSITAITSVSRGRSNPKRPHPQRAVAEPATCRLRTSLPLDVNVSPAYSPTRGSTDCDFRRRYAVQPPSPSPNRPTRRPRPQYTEDAMDNPMGRGPSRDILRQSGISTLDPPNPIPPPTSAGVSPRDMLKRDGNRPPRTHRRVTINECISVNLACWMRKGIWKLRRRGARLKFGKLRPVWPNRINATGAWEFALAPPPMGRSRPDYSPRLLARVVLGNVRSCAARPARRRRDIQRPRIRTPASGIL